MKKASLNADIGNSTSTFGTTSQNGMVKTVATRTAIKKMKKKPIMKVHGMVRGL